DPEGKFQRANGAPKSGLEAFGNSRATLFSDIDGDGDLDILISNVIAAPTLLRNELPSGGSWLQIRLVHPTLSPVVGARVTLSAGGREHRRDVAGTPSYGGSSTSWIHFGLGAATEVENVVVRWPNGESQSLGTLAVNQRVRVPKPAPPTGTP
ncbi:MAG: hypothetical protein ACI9OJ_001279, partial [Myxococcota bacterium]